MTYRDEIKNLLQMTCGLFWEEGWTWNQGNMGVSLAKLWGMCCGETLNNEKSGYSQT